jgi:hypothetical protein
MKQLKPLIIFTAILLLICLVLVYLLPRLGPENVINPEDRRGGKEMVLKNYGRSIDSAAEVLGINPSYLKALCLLECSGRKVFQPRFEPHVFRRLRKVKFGELERYEHIRKEMLIDADDAALENLASSWGPFQLMGYKCLQLGIKVRDIRGEQSVFYGAKWILLTYGKYLKEGKYRDAFHIHNTGLPYPASGKPKTYDPQYCERGLSYMKYYDTAVVDNIIAALE